MELFEDCLSRIQPNEIRKQQCVRLFGKEMGLLFGIQGKLVNYQVQLLTAFFLIQPSTGIKE